MPVEAEPDYGVVDGNTPSIFLSSPDFPQYMGAL